MSARIPSARHGTPVVGTRSVTTSTGSHRAGNVHAGRCEPDEARSMAASR